MKIAINTRFLLPDKMEGIGRFTYEVLHRLVLQHPEHEFIFFFDRPFDEQFIFESNITPVVVSPPARHPFLWYWWFERSLPEVLKNYNPQVFFSPDGFCSLRAQIPTIMVTHDIAHVHYPRAIPRLVYNYYQYFVPRYLHRADHIITVSEYVKNDINKHYHISPDKIQVAHNGCQRMFTSISDTQRVNVKRKYGIHSPYFLYIGAIHPRKNLALLIRAFDYLKQSTGLPIKLILGGRLTWGSREVKRAYQNAKFRNDIQWLGYVPDEDIPPLMAGARSFIYISKHEGFGLPLLEAMYAEVPIITSNASALPEVAGDAALFVDPNSEEEVVKAMHSVMTNDPLRKKLIEKGKSQRAKFSWENTAQIVFNKIMEAAKG